MKYHNKFIVNSNPGGVWHFNLKCLLGALFFAVASFVMAAPSNGLAPGESIGIALAIPPLANLRDIGGYVTEDGKIVVRGKTYRSNAFYPMNSDDLAKLVPLRLKNDFDLRNVDEVKAQPDNLPVGVRYEELNVLADSKDVTTPTQIEELLQNPQLAEKKLGGIDGVDQTYFSLYKGLVSLPSARKSYRILFLALLDSTTSPNVFHCTNGKDRTGWAAAAFLTLLGVPKQEVFTDYMRSNEYLLPMHQKQIDIYVAKGGNRDIATAFFGVKKKYLEASYSEVERRYGSMENYFKNGLHISLTQQKKLREIYLVDNKVDR